MKKALFFILTLLTVRVIFAQNSVWFEGDYSDALKAAKNENKHILIDFYSDG